MTITRDTAFFTVGSPAVVTCSSDSGVADRIEWRSGEGQVLVTSNSVQQLDLTFAPVNDSIHGSNITCFVTRDEGRANQTVSNQTLFVSVRGGCVSCLRQRKQNKSGWGKAIDPTCSSAYKCMLQLKSPIPSALIPLSTKDASACFFVRNSLACDWLIKIHI